MVGRRAVDLASGSEGVHYRHFGPNDIGVLRELHRDAFPLEYELDFYSRAATGDGILAVAAVADEAACMIEKESSACGDIFIPIDDGVIYGNGIGGASDPVLMSVSEKKALAAYKCSGVSLANNTCEKRDNRLASESHADGHQIVGFITSRLATCKETRATVEATEAVDIESGGHLIRDNTLRQIDGGSVGVYLMTIGVTRNWRRRGIASKLLGIVLDNARRQHSGRIVVYLHVIPQNKAAMRFYEREGFLLTGVVRNYYLIDNVRFDAYLYTSITSGDSALLSPSFMGDALSKDATSISDSLSDNDSCSKRVSLAPRWWLRRWISSHISPKAIYSWLFGACSGPRKQSLVHDT